MLKEHPNYETEKKKFFDDLERDMILVSEGKWTKINQEFTCPNGTIIVITMEGKAAEEKKENAGG